MLDPLPSSQWNEATAAHLLKRAGFGAPHPADLAQWTTLGLDAAVDRLVEWERTPDPTPELDWLQAITYPIFRTFGWGSRGGAIRKQDNYEK
jgi:hypothetical protein